MSQLKENILSTLAYFDMFNYPLTGSEIHLFLKNKCQQYEFDDALLYLLLNGLVYKFDKFYSLKNDQLLIARRNNNNKRAADIIKIAGKVSETLIRFPYVRGVAIAGPLSKKFAAADADIGLFIITTKNRLWIARTLMQLFKKQNVYDKKGIKFGMNYYIDEAQLEIAEKTLYTATEIMTMIPLQGDNVFERFYTANAWTCNYFPNKIMRLSSAKAVKSSVLKSTFETIFNNPLGNAVDTLLMKLTTKRRQRKASPVKLNNATTTMAASKHYYKPDTRGFQSKLMLRHESRVFDILHPMAIGISH